MTKEIRTTKSGHVAISVVVLCSLGCGGGQPEGQSPAMPTKPIKIVVSGDTQGWIVPCGCASNQSGGLPRRGRYVADLRQSNRVLLVDVGGAASGSAPYDRAKFEAILKGELLMHISAHNLGESELKLGVEALRDVAARLKAPFVSANTTDKTDEPIVPPGRLVSLVSGETLSTFLVVGVVSPRYATAEIRVSEPREAILRQAQAFAGLYRHLIVLAYLPEPELRELAANLPEADVVVGGPTGQSIAPTSVGRRCLASATNKGKFLVELSSGAEPWSGRVIELDKTFDDDDAQRRNLDAFRSALAERDFSASETSFVSHLSAARADYRIAGSAACRDCHTEEFGIWESSRHARAWSTLEKQGAHVDAACQLCHTTGFGLPGGFDSAKRSPDRVHVGCESCHGPSLAHADEPSRRTPFRAADQCRACHDRENSPAFDFATDWERVRHGKPAAKEAIQ